jgi:hypothetical protein
VEVGDNVEVTVWNLVGEIVGDTVAVVVENTVKEGNELGEFLSGLQPIVACNKMIARKMASPIFIAIFHEKIGAQLSVCFDRIGIIPCKTAKLQIFLRILCLKAQRLAAQPLGHVRFVAIILTGILKSQSSVLTMSLGQVGCGRGLGGRKSC